MDEKRQSKVEHSVIMYQAYPSMSKPFAIRYITLDKVNKGKDVYFNYVQDSMMNMGVMLRPDREGDLLRVIFQASNDTLLKLFLGDNHVEYEEKHTYVKVDSLKFDLEKANHTLFKYIRVDCDSIWKGSLYFSKDYGVLYEKYEHFDIQTSIKEHYAIPSKYLEALMEDLSTEEVFSK